MINTFYTLSAVIGAFCLWHGADYRAIGISMVLVGVATFARYYI